MLSEKCNQFLKNYSEPKFFVTRAHDYHHSWVASLSPYFMAAMWGGRIVKWEKVSRLDSLKDDQALNEQLEAIKGRPLGNTLVKVAAFAASWFLTLASLGAVYAVVRRAYFRGTVKIKDYDDSVSHQILLMTNPNKVLYEKYVALGLKVRDSKLKIEVKYPEFFVSSEDIQKQGQLFHQFNRRVPLNVLNAILKNKYSDNHRIKVLPALEVKSAEFDWSFFQKEIKKTDDEKRERVILPLCYNDQYYALDYNFESDSLQLLNPTGMDSRVLVNSLKEELRLDEIHVDTFSVAPSVKWASGYHLLLKLVEDIEDTPVSYPELFQKYVNQVIQAQAKTMYEAVARDEEALKYKKSLLPDLSIKPLNQLNELFNDYENVSMEKATVVLKAVLEFCRDYEVTETVAKKLQLDLENENSAKIDCFAKVLANLMPTMQAAVRDFADCYDNKSWGHELKLQDRIETLISL